MPLFGQRGNGRKAAEPATRIFFATDIHGSEVCFRKFINAARFYNVQHIILGGDITGKAIVPVQRTSRGWTMTVQEEVLIDGSESDRDALEKKARDAGLYPLRGEADELAALADEGHRHRVFVDLVCARIREWVALAEERLGGSGVRCFITPGNDDYQEIDEPLRNSNVVEFVEGNCVQLDEIHEMITTGYSNITPWDSPRELEEDALGERIEKMYSQVRDPDNLVAVLHAPPYGSSLDQAPAIDKEFRLKFEAGGAVMVGVGSLAVRRFIEQRQPLCALHGHVHESRAVETIGRTLVVNPGSEYTDGRLNGALVVLGRGRVISHQFVAG